MDYLTLPCSQGPGKRQLNYGIAVEEAWGHEELVPAHSRGSGKVQI